MIWESILREFGRHKLRTILTMIGIMIGIMLVTSISSISEGITYYVNDQIAITSGLVTVVEKGVMGFMVQQSEIDEDLVEDVRSISGVEDVASILFVNLDDVGSATGTLPENEDILRGVNIELEEGRDFDEGANEIVIGSTIADRYGYAVGDVLKTDETELEIVGILQESGDGNIDGSYNMHLRDLQELGNKVGKISIMMVKPLSATDADFIEQTINDEFDDIQAASDKSLMNSVNDMLGQLSIMTFALGSIAALISGIVIMNVMIISVRERRREIGTMKAVGATNKQILLTILIESISISVIGAIVGIIISFGGAIGINSILPQPLALVTPRLVLQGILFAAFIGAVSGILPARQAAKLSPIEALRYE